MLACCAPGGIPVDDAFTTDLVDGPVDIDIVVISIGVLDRQDVAVVCLLLGGISLLFPLAVVFAIRPCALVVEFWLTAIGVNNLDGGSAVNDV